MQSKKNRWQINKLGLVNFWYYDYEEIPVYDGKLLLRGGNGSGKSVTLQSFIPLLLDGNRATERLDPFGTRSRKLDNYMLREGELERTAYLFIEFKKNGIENYITAGMGIKAQKDRTTDVWYFIVRDGKRVGKDISLKRKEQGEEIVLQKKQLQNIMKESGLFFESQKAYMEAMNDIFFGFEDIEHYENLLNLIINIRSPKLSKDFKPTVMYEILNSSLKTLDNEDLKSISEAMEEMDTIKNQIEDSKKALISSKEIKVIFDRYNKIVLFNKQRKKIEFKKTLKKSIERSEDLKNVLLNTTASLKDLEKEIELLKSEKETTTEEIKLLQKDDNFKKYEESVNLEKELEVLEIRLNKKAIKLDEKKSALNKKIKKASEIEEQLKDLENNYLNMKENLNNNLTAMGLSDLYSLEQLKVELSNLKQKLNLVRKDIEKYESFKKNFDSLELKLEENNFDIQNSKKEGVRLENLLIENGEEYKESFIEWQEKCEVLKFSDKDSFHINELVTNYSVDSNIEKIKKYIEDMFYSYERDIKLKLERISLNSSNIKNRERLKKQNIPHIDLKSEFNLDLIAVEKEYKNQVLNFKYNEFGNYIFLENTLEKNLLKENGTYEFENIAGKIDLNEKIFTREELEYLENKLLEEFENIPTLMDLKAGQESFEEYEEHLFSLEKERETLRSDLKNLDSEIKKLDTLIYEKLKDLPIEKTIDSLNFISEIREESLETILELQSFEKEREILKSNTLSLEEEIISLEIENDELYDELSSEKKEINSKKSSLKTLKNLCENLDFKNIEERLKKLKDKEIEIPIILEKYSLDFGKKENQKENLENDLKVYEEEIEKNRLNLINSEKIYDMELALGYVQENDLKDFNEAEELTAKRAEIILAETINKHSNSLADYKIKSKILFSENEESERVDYTFIDKRTEKQLFYLEEHLKAQIEDLELLITAGDRKIFEEILLENLSQKVLAIIFNSQKWINKINELMKNLETTSSLMLELKWEPKKSESEEELGTQELLKILNGKGRLTEDEKKRFTNHFLTKIKKIINRSQNEENEISYYNIIKEVLDFRKWFEFKLFFWKKNDTKKEMTNNNFFQLSGGEKAISMYLPLLAALYARYEHASPTSPRIVAMDEAFAGVDEKNIGMLFSHLESLDLDYILNSQILWGDYESVKDLSICEILREENDTSVALINYRWNGQERELKTYV